MRYLVLALMMVALTACDKAQETSTTASRVSKQWVDDTKGAWRDLFTYHRARAPQGPQTRYCYQMQSDIACYDTPQTQMTSKLVGYQDGENISFIKQGGGAIGVSAGQSQVFDNSQAYPNSAAPYSDVVSDDMMAYPQTGQEIRVDETNTSAPLPNPTACTPGMTPFECKESQYIPNADVGR